MQMTKDELIREIEFVRAEIHNERDATKEAVAEKDKLERKVYSLERKVEEIEQQKKQMKKTLHNMSMMLETRLRVTYDVDLERETKWSEELNEWTERPDPKVEELRFLRYLYEQIPTPVPF